MGEMKKAITFSEPMVLALIDGRKTQTRRILKQQPGPDWKPDTERPVECKSYGFKHEPDRFPGWSSNLLVVRSPYAIGSRLWVREAWRTLADYDDQSGAEIGEASREAGAMKPWAPIRYEADGSRRKWKYDAPSGRYRHARFMPRWASRFTLKVTDVRVQRLNDISRDDAIAEGLLRVPAAPEAVAAGCDWGFTGDSRSGSPVSAFAALWDTIYGPGAWGSNPWVAATSFRLSRRNVDQPEERAT